MATAAQPRSANRERSAGRPNTGATLERALDALELLAERSDGVGVGELARELDVSAPSAHRLLATLLSRGYARQDPATSRYAIGLRCFSLATLASAELDLRATAAAHLRQLNQLTGETVHLALYSDGEVIYIDRLEGAHAVGPISRIGARAPAHCVSAGRAILAYLPDGEIDALLARGLEGYTDRTATTRDQLDADRTAVRQRGYAINEGSWRPEIGGVGAPIRDFSGQVRASIAVCLPRERFSGDTRPELIRLTVEAGAAISADLGFVVPAAPGGPAAPTAS